MAWRARCLVLQEATHDSFDPELLKKFEEAARFTVHSKITCFSGRESN